MAELVKCPLCGEDIENDSYFCDQCGAELLKCPKCGCFRRGKFCGQCGVATQPASVADVAKQQAQPKQETQQQAQPKQQPQQPQQSQQQPQAQPQAQAQPQSQPKQAETQHTQIPTMPTRLVCAELGITLPLKFNALIGRKMGDYVDQLSGLQYLSGSHALLSLDGTSWSITDLSSTNGTVVNNERCLPTQPFKKGDTICFATVYYFRVE